MAVFTEQAYPNAMAGPTAARPTYLLTLQAAPGHDDIRSLRALLKAAGAATACVCFPFASCHRRLGISARQAGNVAGPLTGNNGVSTHSEIIRSH
jgi:hypothetical protein